MYNYLWPILIVVISNTFYNICAKSTPEDIHPFISLTITYIVAAIISIIVYFATNDNTYIISEIKKANWSSLVLGIAIIGLEFGYIQVYRVGWNVSVGSLVANIGLAIVLVFVGIFLYKETLSISQLFGIILCILGIIFLNPPRQNFTKARFSNIYCC